MKKLLVISICCVGATILGYVSYLYFAYAGMRHRTPFDEAHGRAVTTFVENKGFGIARLKGKNLWNEWSVLLEGKEYEAREINLIGLTPENGSRYFVDRKPHMGKDAVAAKHRPLAPDESKAIEEFRRGEGTWVKLPVPKENERIDMRVLAPIRAQQGCVKCHGVKIGEIIGMLDYHLQKLEVVGRTVQN